MNTEQLTPVEKLRGAQELKQLATGFGPVPDSRREGRIRCRIGHWSTRFFHREGWAEAKIAELLGMSRNAVVRLLDLVGPREYERAPRASKLDPRRGSIVKILNVDPKVPATVVIERLRRDGYGGGITILKDYLQEVRPLFVAAKSYQRTSYFPDEVGHTDWWEPEIQIPSVREPGESIGLVTTLPHSAAHATVFDFSKTMADFLPASSGTLQRLGGALEKVVVNRDSSIVVPRSRPARFHREVTALFAVFRIGPVILGPRKPESKGQVERTVGYLERSFLPLRSFEDLADRQSQQGVHIQAG